MRGGKVSQMEEFGPTSAGTLTARGSFRTGVSHMNWRTARIAALRWTHKQLLEKTQ